MQERSFIIVTPEGTLISTLQEPDMALAAKVNIRAGRYTARPNGAQLQEIAGKVEVVVASTFEFRDAAEAQPRCMSWAATAEAVSRASLSLD